MEAPKIVIPPKCQTLFVPLLRVPQRLRVLVQDLHSVWSFGIKVHLYPCRDLAPVFGLQNVHILHTKTYQNWTTSRWASHEGTHSKNGQFEKCHFFV